MGVYWGDYMYKNYPAFAQSIDMCLQGIESGDISPHVGAVLPLSEVSSHYLVSRFPSRFFATTMTWVWGYSVTHVCPLIHHTVRLVTGLVASISPVHFGSCPLCFKIQNHVLSSQRALNFDCFFGHLIKLIAPQIFLNINILSYMVIA